MAVLGIGADAFYYLRSTSLTEEKTVIIPKGSSLNHIVRELAQEQIIRFPLLFKANAVLLQQHLHLKAGEYLFPAGITPEGVLQKMVAGDVVIRRVTVPEGYTSAQIVALLQAEPALSGEIMEGTAEGSLLPETYFFTYGDNRESILNRMRARMQKNLAALWEKRQEGLPLTSPQEALTLASIVEKETGKPEERERVSAVFINRLRKGMPLQSDPTVIYALTEGKRVLERPLTTNDLRIDSPYNTYKNPGLPPAPITNPGLASIKAALHPLQTSELYFVADGNGGHVFSATLGAHNDNVRQYRKKIKEANAAKEKE